MNKTQKKYLIDKYCKHVQFFVEEIEDDFFLDEDERRTMERIALKKEQFVKFSVQLKGDGETSKKAVVLFRFKQEGKDAIVNELGEYIKKNLDENEKKVFLIGVVDKVSEKNTLLNILQESRNQMHKIIKRPVYSIGYDIIFMPEIDRKPIEIKVTRMNSLIFPEPNTNINVMPMKCEHEEKEEVIKGYIFVANLFDLVDIYDRVGDELFSCNLRYGIEDKMSLESSMKNTLLEEPDMFWFFNNGITIVTDKDNIGLNNVGKIVLTSRWDKFKLDFSVINGAQTISTASRIFGDKGLDINKINTAKDNAKVLLRIIFAKKSSAKQKITIALNRQKPIKSEDIAFQSPFISSYNAYMSKREADGKDYLYIIKRGESTCDSNTIELPTFAQLVYTCFMNPSEARNSGPSSLYYSDKKAEKLNSSYFIDKFAEPTSLNSQDDVFAKYYQEIAWAYRVYLAYNAELKAYSNKDEKMILANNRWSFIAYQLKSIMNFSGKVGDIDYSDFSASKDLISDIRKHMDDFVSLVKGIYGESYTPELSKGKTFWERICSLKTEDTTTESESKEIDIDKDEFIKYLTETSFVYDSDLEEYSSEVDCVAFSNVTIRINDDTFDISATLLDPYSDLGNERDESGNRYAALLDSVVEKFCKEIGKRPDVEDYWGCSDLSADIQYSGEHFNTSFVEKFICLMRETA